MMPRIPPRVLLLFGLAIGLLVAGNLLFQYDFVPLQMCYGNFDVPGQRAFVNRLEAGVRDLASLKVYVFDRIHWHPVFGLVGILFPLTLLIGLYKRRDAVREAVDRVVVQWISFVIARLGIFRVAGIYPVRRSCLGVFPFLNCQACEMATGACPIGLAQNLLNRGTVPFALGGTLLLSGMVLGKSICGWLCPFGFVADLFDRFCLRLAKIPRQLGYLRYWVLGLIVVAPVLFLHLGITDHNFFCSTLCASGKLLGLLPYYLTTAQEEAFPITAGRAGLIGPGGELAAQLGLTLLVVVVMLLVSGRAFCRVLCPLGGLWGLFYNVSLVRIRHRQEQCTGCGACEEACPMGVTRGFADFLDRSSCMACGRCIQVCSPAARSFEWGVPSGGQVAPGITAVEEKDEENDRMIDPSTITYGSLYHRLRRDFYLIAMALMAKSPLDMARYAYEQTLFYRRLYGRPPQDFGSLPLARKQDLGRCDPYDVLSDECRNQVMLYGETTGSTGFPTPVFYTRREFEGARVLAKITPFTSALEDILTENRAVINGLTFGFTIAGLTFGDFLAAVGGVVANVGSRSTIATPPRMARAMTRLRPSVMTGTPIDLLCWMRILQEDHPQEYPKVREFLKLYLSTAELCAQSRSLAIRREFGLVHLDIYACVEGFFTVPCPCGELHVMPIYHTELFDPDLRPVGTFGEGRLAFTNLVKKSSPFVRYLLDDWVTIFPSECPHGFKKSITPHGRFELTVRLGDRLLGVRHFEEAIFQHGLFGDYRVTLEDSGLRFLVEEYGQHDPVDVIRTHLGDTFRQPVEVELVPFGTLTKYREVRVTKPILKVEDKRSSSTQKIPEYL